MHLQSREPPADVYQAVHDRLGALSQYSAFFLPRLRQAREGQLFISTPHRVGVLAVSGDGSEEAWYRHIEIKGWRFLVHHGEDVVAAIDTVPDGDGGHQVGHLTEGPLVTGTADAIRWAETVTTAGDGSFEPIFVLAPLLHVALLLLREGDAAGVAYAVAIPPHLTELPPRELLPPDRVAAEFRRIRARRVTTA